MTGLQGFIDWFWQNNLTPKSRYGVQIGCSLFLSRQLWLHNSSKYCKVEIMDYYDCFQIRSNVASFSALIGDSDVEEFPYLPKTRYLEAVLVHLSSSPNMANPVQP